MFIYATGDVTVENEDDLLAMTAAFHNGPLTLTAGWNFVVMELADVSSMPPTITSEVGPVGSLNAYFDPPEVE